MKRLRLILIVLAVLLAGVLVFCLVQPKEPSYQGKTLTEWLFHEFPYSGRSAFYELIGDRWVDIDDGTITAMEELGTNAVPKLLALLRATDGNIKAGLIKLANRQTIFKTRLHSAHEKHQAALLGFCCLGSNALSAVPELIQLTRHVDAEVSGDALVCLDCVAQGGSFLLPWLADRLHDTNVVLKELSAEILACRYRGAAERLGVYEMFPQMNQFYPRLGPSTTNAPEMDSQPTK